MEKNEFENLKKDLKNNELKNFYIFYGNEDFLKEFYLKKIEDFVVDKDFKEFNLEKIDGNKFDIDIFSSALESFPAMSEKKMIIVRDFDLLKVKADIKDDIIKLLSDIPDYVCLIFDYATIEFKRDRKQKIDKILDKNASIVSFEHLSQKDINKWIKKKLSIENIEIEDKVCDYLTFNCSMSMTNLSNECTKLISYCENEVKKEDIDAVCFKILEAKIYDVTEKILSKDLVSAQKIIDDLILLKNDEFMILSVINSQFQRLYCAKLGLLQNKTTDFFMGFWKTKSSYMVKINLKQAQKYDIGFLRKACNLCARATVDMVSLNTDKSKLLQILIVKIGAINAKS